MITRASTDVPDQLYNLEIRQYDVNGNHLTGNDYGTVNIGTSLDVTLQASDDCQLVLVARGSGSAVAALGAKTLEQVQSMIVNSSVINAIDPSVTGSMNAMPYVLHLKHVKVATVNGKAIIQSPDGSYDMRLMLKRLATRLTVTWDYSVTDYKLKQLLIQSVPLNYTIVDRPETDGTYPSIVSQFTTLEKTIANVDAAHGSYSCWVPANVRGESAAATTETQRTKANAPVGSTFFNFVAVNTTDGKKKFDYRVYIGSGSSTDFNMYRNKDYVYTVNFAHVGIPTGDNRVTYIDPIPASENNDNLVPTANCFMVEPGGAFCFDPFVFQQNGAEITNSQMTGWYPSTAGTGIKSVRLLWQTRENGDVGDPVMGIANSDDDHTNIVDIKRTIDNSDINTVPANGKGQCRIYCRVAANTTGGNGVIAAYDGPDGTGNIVWSWHVWVTDYKPDTRGGEQVLEPVNKRKLLFSLNNASVLPMMDRNLGAMAGYVDEAPTSFVEMSKTNGFHYQWGRKDPFPSSYTTKKISVINNKNSSTPPEGMLNRYAADGITYVVNGGQSGTISYQTSCRQPLVFYAASNKGPAWTNIAAASFKGWDETDKPVWDPCPAGWRVISQVDLAAVCQNGSSLPNNNIKNYNTRNDDGGYLLYFEQLNGGHASYFRFTGYGRFMDTFEYIGDLCSIWTRTKGDDGDYRTYAGWFNTESAYGIVTKYQSDAHPLRCVQEKAD
ncbi:DUF4906 domain-containing protein [Bacteroides intestinalis]|uniref:DUF4906 domain-containing protein n=1 Tax=Bacteroides intestinalis TaxID=329854 RepID=A0A412XP68_9BACE|nr:DUF4906 domain-containing protein [Bacteroides intestinalis]RGV46967.1 DUF4906 domain-containing protein [Bacteroides intestinalis]